MSQMFLIFLAYYAVNCFSNVYFIFGPFYERFGASPREIGLFLSIFYMAMILCRPLGSFVMERLGIRRALVGSSIISAAAAAGIALSLSNPAMLLFFRAVSGVSESVFIVATVAYQSMILTEKTRGVGFALFTTGSMLPMATIVPLSEWLLETARDDLYIWLPFAVALICLIISLAVKDISVTARKEKVWGTYSEMFKTKGIRYLYLTSFIMALADGATLSIAILADEIGVAVSWFMVSVAIAAVLTRTLGFKIMDRSPRMLLAAPAGALMGGALLLLTFSSNAFLFALFGVLFGVGIGVGFPTDLSLVGDLVPIEFHPKATGGLLLAIDFGWVLTPLIFGAISPLFGSGGAFRLIALAVLVSSLLIHFILWLPLYKKINAGV